MAAPQPRIIPLDVNSVLSKLLSSTVVTSLMVAAIFPVAHMLLHKYVITPVGKRWLGMRGHKKMDDIDDDPVLESRLTKFQESAWKCLLYTFLTCISTYALRNETFWRNTTEFWTGCENSLPCKYEASSEMNFAYAVDMAYYAYAIPYLLVFEEKRNDFWATFWHHVATVILIGYSFALGWTKVGLVIMILHDVCDPFLELAKIAKYANQEALTNTFFILFVMVWCWMRMVYFPFWVNWSVLFEGYEIAVGVGNKLAFPHYQILAGLLVFLQCLQAFWTYFIVKIAWNAVMHGSSDDVREAGEDSK